jgi:hypothetical protein
MNTSFFCIRQTDGSSIWLNLNACIELYIDKLNSQIVAHRTKDEYFRYANVTAETCNELENVLAARITPATLTNEILAGLRVLSDELFAAENPAPAPAPLNDEADDLPFSLPASVLDTQPQPKGKTTKGRTKKDVPPSE